MRRKHPSVRPAVHWLLPLMLIFAPSLILAHDEAADDPFPACMAETGGEGTACLERQGNWYSWRVSEAACRFVGARVDAVIAAGGEAKWTDLFRNERCARLGLPHGPVAAVGGTTAVSLSEQCMVLSGDCLEFLERHKWDSYWSCPAMQKSLTKAYRKGAFPSILRDIFFNERCWRLNLPHFEPE